MTQKLRPIKAIVESATKRIKRNPVEAPPRLAWLSLDVLVVDESYQRELAPPGVRLVRRLVERWNWNSYKPLSVAPVGDGLYEVIDGQHTAIAAATHGAIEQLPCLVQAAGTRASRAAAFVGINQDRLTLTPFALYRARLAADEPEATGVEAALAAAGVTLEESFRKGADYSAGVAVCPSALLLVHRRSGVDHLTRLLRIALAGRHTPIRASLLRALDEIVRANDVADEALARALRDVGETLGARADERRLKGLAASPHDGIVQVLLHQLDARAA